MYNINYRDLQGVSTKHYIGDRQMTKQLADLQIGDVIQYPDGAKRIVYSDVLVDAFGNANFQVKVSPNSTIHYAVSYEASYQLEVLA